MGTPFVGEIRMFGGNFNPNGWAFCAGQLMPISQNDTLFNLIGTTYGGDGQSTFGIPDLQGRVPVHMGQGPGISQNYTIGEKAGVESVTLTTNQIPIHTHPPLANGTGASAPGPGGNMWAQWSDAQFSDAGVNAQMAAALSQSGGSQPHDNMIPFLVISFIISLFGIFPSQN